MKTRSRRSDFARAVFASALGALLVAPGCNGEDCGGLYDLASECGLVCPAGRLTLGHATLTDIASLDTMFGSVIALANELEALELEMSHSLRSLTRALGLPDTADPETISARVLEIATATGNSSLHIEYAEPPCSVDTTLVVSAFAWCDQSVDVGEAVATCDGPCRVPAVDTGLGGSPAVATCEASVACFGLVSPPSGSAECEVHALIQGVLHQTCSNSHGKLATDDSTNLPDDPTFLAWAHDFNGRMSHVRALSQRLNLSLDVATRTTQSASELHAKIEALRDGDVDLKTSIGLDCGLKQLDEIAPLLDQKVERAETTAAVSQHLVDSWTVTQ